MTAAVMNAAGTTELARRVSEWPAGAGVIWYDLEPLAASINPASTASGGGTVNVTLTGTAGNDPRAGTGFPPGSCLCVDGTPLATTPGTNTLTAAVPKKATAGTKVITVRTPSLQESDPLTLTFT